MLIKRQHSNYNYTALFNTCTGFFARIEDPGHPEPFWSPNGPELLDIAVTRWCDRACSQCYRAANRNGKHMPVSDYRILIAQAAELGVFQVALGGGNPNQHPNFVSLLQVTRLEYDIVPNYTTNGRGLMADIITASSKYCGAVAVSAYEPYQEMASAIECLCEAGVKVNVHFVLDSGSIQTALEWLDQPPSFLKDINALIFLAYKPVGRVACEKSILHGGLATVSQLVKHACSNEHDFKVGFDSCMVPAIATFTDCNPVYFDACEAARFSMFVSEDLTLYPCSFMEGSYDGKSLRETSLHEEWKNGKLFKDIRNRLMNHSCSTCPASQMCLGGCPAFPDLDVCGHLL